MGDTQQEETPITCALAFSRFGDIGCGMLVSILCLVSLTAMLVTSMTKLDECWEHLVPVVGGLLTQLNPVVGKNTCTQWKTAIFDQKCNSSMPHVFLNDYKCFTALTVAKQADWQKWNRGLDDHESVIHKRAEGDKQMVDDMQKTMKNAVEGSYEDKATSVWNEHTFKFEGTGDWGAHTWGSHLLDAVLPQPCVDACYAKARTSHSETPLTVCNDKVLSKAVGEGAICSNSVKTIVVNGSCDLFATVAATLPMGILVVGLLTFIFFSFLPGRRLMEWQMPTCLERTTLVIYALVVQLVIAASYLFDITYRGSDGVFEAADQHAACQPIDHGLVHPRNKKYECIMAKGFSLASLFKALALIGGSTAIFPMMIDFLDRWIFRLQEEDNKDKEFKCAPQTGHCCKLRIPKSLIKVCAFALSVFIVLFEQTLRLYYEVGQWFEWKEDSWNYHVFWYPSWIHDWIPSNMLRNLYLHAGSSQDPIGVLEIEIISKLPVILATACLLQKTYYWQKHVAKSYKKLGWMDPTNKGWLAPEGKQDPAGEGEKEPWFGFPSFSSATWDANNKKEEATEFIEKDGAGKIFVEKKKEKGSKMDSELEEGADLELFGGPEPERQLHHTIKGGNYKLEPSPCGKGYAVVLVVLGFVVFFIGLFPMHKGVLQALGMVGLFFVVGVLLVVLMDWGFGRFACEIWFKEKKKEKTKDEKKNAEDKPAEVKPLLGTGTDQSS